MKLGKLHCAALAALAGTACWLLPAATTAHGHSEGEGIEFVPENWAEIATHVDVVEEPDSPATDHGEPKFAAGPALNSRRQPEGALSGRIVYMGAGHGWTYQTDLSRTPHWYLQRPNTHNMVEDYGNIDQMALFAAYCWNAGATVVPTRPIGFQTNEVVMTQSHPGVSYSGTWLDSQATPYYGEPGDSVSYRFAYTVEDEETATARYTPDIPEAGVYPVYTWVLNSFNRVHQLYRIRHAGGITETRVNHRAVGKGWVWLGNYYFEEGEHGWVEISNDRSPGDNAVQNSVIIADAIRFGNGMGDLDYGRGVSGFPREDEASRYWAAISTGTPPATSVFAPSGLNHQSQNVGTPPRWAAYMNNENEGEPADRVYIGFHTNAGGGRGADGLINPNPVLRTQYQAELAEYLGREINENMRDLHQAYFSDYPAWSARTHHVYVGHINYGEQNANSINNEMDACIIEVAFHDNASDALWMRDPRGRRAAARSTLKAVIRYFNEFGGAPLEFPPDEPRQLRALNAQDGTGDIMLSWKAPVVIPSTHAGTPGNASGDPPDMYAIYTSSHGRDFDFVAEVPATQTSFRIGELEEGEALFAWVTAVNAGGESFPSNVAGATSRRAGTPPVLIVDGFNRNHSSNALTQTISGIPHRSSPGTFTRVIPRQTNDFSYVVEAGTAVMEANPNVHFDYVTNEAADEADVALLDYESVVWILGEESTRDRTFNDNEQALVTEFLAEGGNLFVSGPEIAWDLGRPAASAANKAFLQNILRTVYVADSSNTYDVEGISGTLFDGLSFQFDDGTAGYYDSRWPDVINPSGAFSSAAMQYVGGTGGNAGIVYDGAEEGRGSIVLLGFPFETITDPPTRTDVMARALEFFGTDGAPPVSDVWLLW